MNFGSCRSVAALFVFMFVVQTEQKSLTQSNAGPKLNYENVGIYQTTESDQEMKKVIDYYKQYQEYFSANPSMITAWNRFYKQWKENEEKNNKNKLNASEESFYHPEVEKKPVVVTSSKPTIAHTQRDDIDSAEIVLEDSKIEIMKHEGNANQDTSEQVDNEREEASDSITANDDDIADSEEDKDVEDANSDDELNYYNEDDTIGEEEFDRGYENKEPYFDDGMDPEEETADFDFDYEYDSQLRAEMGLNFDTDDAARPVVYGGDEEAQFRTSMTKSSKTKKNKLNSTFDDREFVGDKDTDVEETANNYFDYNDDEDDDDSEWIIIQSNKKPIQNTDFNRKKNTNVKNHKQTTGPTKSSNNTPSKNPLSVFTKWVRGLSNRWLPYDTDQLHSNVNQRIMILRKNKN